MQPLLSIVIPTKNRQRFCLSAVKSILLLEESDIQIVIQDNSDDNSLEKQLPLLDDNLLKYSYVSETVSFVENFNRAIDLADGKYICIIGDDDGISPMLMTVVRWANNNNVEAFTGKIVATYRWDNVGSRKTFFRTIKPSCLSITEFNGKVKKVYSEDSLIKLMENGCTNYLEYDFPKLYHGVVSKSSLERIKSLTGEYLKGLSPDIYASLALALTIDKFIVIDYPLSVPGVCSESGSIKEGERKENTKNLKDAPHLKGRKIPYNWDRNVPKVYSVQTIWADSALAALNEFKRDDLISRFNQYMLFANMIDADSDLRSYVNSYLKENNDYTWFNAKIKLNLALLKGPYYKFFYRNFKRFLRFTKLEKYENINNLKNMEEVTIALREYLLKINIDLNKNLNNLSKMNKG